MRPATYTFGDKFSHRKFAEAFNPELHAGLVGFKLLDERLHRMILGDYLVAAIAADEHEGSRTLPMRHIADEIDGGMIAPVQIFQYQDHGLLARDRLDKIRDLHEHSLPSARWGHGQGALLGLHDARDFEKPRRCVLRDRILKLHIAFVVHGKSMAGGHMKHVYFVSYLLISCTLTVVDAEAVGNRNLSEVPEDRAANVGVDDDSAPVDLGWGPRRGPSARKSSGFKEFDAAALTPPPDAHINGVFGAPFSMRLIPIHAALLPNGNTYYYGTDQAGNQGAKFLHAVWEPELGSDEVFDTGTHKLLPPSTGTDTFCAAQVLTNSGKLMITGGDAIVNGQRNWSNWDTNVYNPGTNELESSQPMSHKRWYPTLLLLANGDMLVLGGRDAKSPPTYSPIPEVYTPATGWKTLSTATSNLAYGGTNTSWFYPRAFPAPNGKVFVLAPDGGMFYLDPNRKRIDRTSDQRKSP